MSPARIARPESFDEAMVQLREGLHYVRVTPAVLIAVVVVGLVSTVGMNFSVIIPPYADEILDSGASGYGFLMAASGVGSLLAALWLAFGRRRPDPLDRLRRDHARRRRGRARGDARPTRSRC